MALTTGIEHLTPSPSKGQLFQGNYITNFDFTNQFLPDVYEKQAEIATKNALYEAGIAAAKEKMKKHK